MARVSHGFGGNRGVSHGLQAGWRSTVRAKVGSLLRMSSAVGSESLVGQIEAWLDAAARGQPPPHDVPDELAAVASRLRDVAHGVNDSRDVGQAYGQLQRAVEQSIDGIAVAAPDGCVQHLNPAWLHMHGYQRPDLPELIGQHLSVFHTPEQMEADVKTFLESYRNNGVFDGEVGHKRRNGSTFPAWMTVAPILDSHGDAVGFVGIARDITERKRTEELERQLEHADRLASLGQLAAGITHEINNPLAYILGNLTMMRARLSGLDGSVAGGLEDVRAMLADCLSGVERIQGIVGNLRGFARIEQDQVRYVDVNEVVATAANMVAHEIRHRARLVRRPGRVPSIPLDAGKLTQVLVNLLVNAAHAVEEGSAEEHRIVVETSSYAGHVIVAVEDDGGGIDDDVLPRIFEPFFTTKSRERGTGLGLSLCQEIVRHYGGQIRIQSNPGIGTRVEVVLPIQNGFRPEIQRARVPTDKHSVSMRILIIDDDALVRRAISRVLGQQHEVIEVSGGGAALDFLDRDKDFDAILCDLMMPELDGPAFHEALQEGAPELLGRIVFISVGAVTPKKKAFVARTRLPVLAKPVDPDELEDVLVRTARQGASSRMRVAE